jgi:hypothetical protein
VAAIQAWCGASCQPSAAVLQWIAEGPPAPAARQRPARAPRAQAASTAPQQEVVRRPPPPPRAVVNTHAQRGGVTIICGSCTF